MRRKANGDELNRSVAAVISRAEALPAAGSSDAEDALRDVAEVEQELAANGRRRRTG